MSTEKRIAIYCVGNKLMLDDGIGPAVYSQLQEYVFPDNVQIFDLGCLTLDRISDVDYYDFILCVDAVDGTDEPPGTIFRYSPNDMARRSFGTQSLHDLKLADLFDAAMLLDYECEGLCLGMQVLNASPAELTIGLSAPVYENLANLVDSVLAVMVQQGVSVKEKQSGRVVAPGFHHTLVSE